MASEPTLDVAAEERVALDAAVKAGVASLDAGRNTPYEAVRRWLMSWGTDKELSPPECP